MTNGDLVIFQFNTFRACISENKSNFPNEYFQGPEVFSKDPEGPQALQACILENKSNFPNEYLQGPEVFSKDPEGHQALQALSLIHI